MTDSALTLAREAVLDKLIAGVTLAKIYAHPPANMKMPAVTLDRSIEDPQDLLADLETALTLTFTLWSTARGPRECERIRDQMRAALHDASFTLAAGGVVMCRWVRSDVTRDADGVTYVGSVLVKLTLEHS